MKKRKESSSTYEKLKEYSIEDVLPFVPEDVERPGPAGVKMYEGHQVKMNSHRYHCFKNSGTVCVSCGLEATHFTLERHKRGHNKQSYHFNLYGKNEKGEEVMLTKDHIIARANGGKNVVENYQTMCSVCNRDKGSSKHIRVWIQKNITTVWIDGKFYKNIDHEEIKPEALLSILKDMGHFIHEWQPESETEK